MQNEARQISSTKRKNYSFFWRVYWIVPLLHQLTDMILSVYHHLGCDNPKLLQCLQFHCQHIAIASLVLARYLRQLYQVFRKLELPSISTWDVLRMYNCAASSNCISSIPRRYCDTSTVGRAGNWQIYLIPIPCSDGHRLTFILSGRTKNAIRRLQVLCNLYPEQLRELTVSALIYAFEMNKIGLASRLPLKSF